MAELIQCDHCQATTKQPARWIHCTHISAYADFCGLACMVAYGQAMLAKQAEAEVARKNETARER